MWTLGATRRDISDNRNALPVVRSEFGGCYAALCSSFSSKVSCTVSPELHGSDATQLGASARAPWSLNPDRAQGPDKRLNKTGASNIQPGRRKSIGSTVRSGDNVPNWQ